MKTSYELYTSDTAQDDKVSPKYGDAQVLIAGEKDKKKKVGKKEIAKKMK